jgi:multiple sugar transport system ATP-binding protein
MTLADRIVVLNQGRIEQTGRPLELYRRPANLFVAAFIGSPSMNLLPATAVRSASGAVAKLADGTVVKLAADVVVTDGQQIVLGLRPENLIPAGEGPALSGPTQLVEPTGAQTHVVFDLAGQHVTAIVDGATEIRVGDQFKVTIDPELTHVFDKASGKRV